MTATSMPSADRHEVRRRVALHARRTSPSALLVVVAAIWVPETLSGVALSAIAPFAALLAITALGQMLVIMTGGIDLSTPGTVTLAAMIMVGVGEQSDGRIWLAILAAVGAGRRHRAGERDPHRRAQAQRADRHPRDGPDRGRTRQSLRAHVPDPEPGAGRTVRLGVEPVPRRQPDLLDRRGHHLVFIVGLRYTSAGRRFQVVGANPVSSHVMGVRVMLTQILVYVVAAVLYAIAGVALAAQLRNPGVNIGSPYLLGPIAAVVIGGASLAGGLASPLSTFAAAFFLTGLNQMMRSLGLATSLQFLVFGLVIIGGMLISGDRIIKGVETLLPRPANAGSPTIDQKQQQHNKQPVWAQGEPCM